MSVVCKKIYLQIFGTKLIKLLVISEDISQSLNQSST